MFFAFLVIIYTGMKDKEDEEIYAFIENSLAQYDDV